MILPIIISVIVTALITYFSIQYFTPEPITVQPNVVGCKGVDFDILLEEYIVEQHQRDIDAYGEDYLNSEQRKRDLSTGKVRWGSEYESTNDQENDAKLEEIIELIKFGWVRTQRDSPSGKINWSKESENLDKIVSKIVYTWNLGDI